MTLKEIKDSLTNQLSKSETFKVELKTTTIKEYKHSDLPIYKKNYGSYYRCRIVDGKIKCDLIRERSNGTFNYDDTIFDVVFDENMKESNEGEWNEVVEKLTKHIKK